MKFFVSLSFMLLGGWLSAQSVSDAILFTQQDLNGTSRYTGMAGAFGALGGDLSAIADNPASASVFSYSEMGISAFFNNNETTASYFSNATTNDFNKLQLQQFGLVFVLKNTSSNSDWTKIAWSFGSKRIADFSNKLNAIGNNPNQNLGDYFTYYADGLATKNIEVFDNETIPGIYEYLGNEMGYGAQQAFLGYQAYVIDPLSDDENNTMYRSAQLAGRVGHDWVVDQQGRHQQYNFTFSVRYRDFLDIGAAINSHNFRYEQTNILTETSDDTNSSLQEVTFENRWDTYGTGVSAQIGIIAKLQKAIRLGLSYQSPQYLRFEEEGSQALISSGLVENETIQTVVRPEVINTYPAYRMQLPAKVSLSMAYVFQEKGLVSVSYSSRNLARTRFNTDSQASYLGGLNNTLNETLGRVSELRLGSEWRTGRFLWQLGYWTTNNAMSSIKDNDRAYTAGINFDLAGNLFGLSWVQSQQYSQRNLYPVGLTSGVSWEQKRTQLFLTYLFKL